MKGTNVVSLVSPHEGEWATTVGDDVSLGVKITTFPDGQRDLRILHAPVYPTARIEARLRNFSDLDLLIMAKRSLDDLGVEQVDLRCPYLPGARSDRRFGKGGTRYLADVVAPIINALGFREVVVWDPHSDVAENVVGRFRNLTEAERLIAKELGCTLEVVDCFPSTVPQHA